MSNRRLRAVASVPEFADEGEGFERRKRLKRLLSGLHPGQEPLHLGVKAFGFCR